MKEYIAQLSSQYGIDPSVAEDYINMLEGYIRDIADIYLEYRNKINDPDIEAKKLHFIGRQNSVVLEAIKPLKNINDMSLRAELTHYLHKALEKDLIVYT